MCTATRQPTQPAISTRRRNAARAVRRLLEALEEAIAAADALRDMPQGDFHFLFAKADDVRYCLFGAPLATMKFTAEVAAGFVQNSCLIPPLDEPAD